MTRIKAHCRTKKLIEGSSWRLHHVEELLTNTDRQDWPPNPKTRVVRVDLDQPFLPGNAKIMCFGI